MSLTRVSSFLDVNLKPKVMYFHKIALEFYIYSSSHCVPWHLKAKLSEKNFRYYFQNFGPWEI